MNHRIILPGLFLLCILFSCESQEPLPPTNNSTCSLSAEGERVVAAAEAVQYSFGPAGPEISDPNLDPLIEYLGNAKIVGLGEATHGSKEFYQMKDKIFRRLVVEKGFKAFIFELPWGNCQIIDDYVFKDERSLEEVANQIPYWVYNTEEVADLIRWMHDYNMGKSDAEKIHFLGNDAQGDNFTVERNIVYDFVDEVAPDSMAFVREQLGNLPSNLFGGAYPDNTTNHSKNETGIQLVRDFLELNEATFKAASGEEEYNLAVNAMKVIEGREKVYRTRDHGLLRDQLMAAFSEDWLKVLGADAKVAVWAHNFHVANGNYSATNKTMGYFLKNTLGDDYKIVAFGFGTGGLNAFLTNAQFGFAGSVRPQKVERLICNSVNHYINETSGERNYFIFDELDSSSELFQFLNQTQDFLSIGAGFNPSFLTQHFYLPRQVLRENDVLMFFDTVERSELR